MCRSIVSSLQSLAAHNGQVRRNKNIVAMRDEFAYDVNERLTLYSYMHKNTTLFPRSYVAKTSAVRPKILQC